MTALITLTHRTVEHNDPAAAGFTDGYWWTVTLDRFPFYVESAAPTAEAAEAYARAVVELHAPNADVTVQTHDELLTRADDEARVSDLITGWRPDES